MATIKTTENHVSEKEQKKKKKKNIIINKGTFQGFISRFNYWMSETNASENMTRNSFSELSELTFPTQRLKTLTPGVVTSAVAPQQFVQNICFSPFYFGSLISCLVFFLEEKKITVEGRPSECSRSVDLNCEIVLKEFGAAFDLSNVVFCGSFVCWGWDYHVFGVVEGCQWVSWGECDLLFVDNVLIFENCYIHRT